MIRHHQNSRRSTWVNHDPAFFVNADSDFDHQLLWSTPDSAGNFYFM